MIASYAAMGMLALALTGAEFRQDAVLGPLIVAGGRDGPTVVVREQEEPPLAAIRLSVQVEEPAGLEGAARIIQELARERLEAEAAEFGGRAALTRTALHAVYSVVGPAAAFDEMVAALRGAVGRPTAPAGRLDAAKLRVRREAAAAAEMPAAVVRRRLERALYPLLPSLVGDPAALASMGMQELDAFWRRSFRRERMAVVVVGPVPAERAVAAFEGWPEPSDPPRRRRPAVPASGDQMPEVIFPWVGLGFAVDDADPAALAVAAVLIEENLALQPLRAASAEVWWGAGRLGLVLIGSGEPEMGEPAAGPSVAERLLSSLADVSAGIDPEPVAAARRTVARRLLFEARTPDGLARLIGEFFDRTGDPEAVLRFLEDIEDLNPEDVRRTLNDLLEQWPMTVEVRP